MIITYNNVEEPSNMVTFTEIPNILKVSEEVSGTKAMFNFFWEGNLQSTVTSDNQYYVTFLGETVSNVTDPTMAKNKRFYISGDEDATAMSFARALRNCSSIAAEFNITCIGPDVYLVAKTIGEKWSNMANYLDRNIPEQNLHTNGTDGSTDSWLFNSLIDIDVYSGTSANRENYITTLEKNYYGNECAFDMSPILATFSDYGKTVPYFFVLNIIMEDGEWQGIGNVSGYTTIGYHANQSNLYKYNSGVEILINTNRGENGMILYTYDNYIPFTLLFGDDRSGYDLKVSVKDSALNEIYAYTTIGRRDRPDILVDSGALIPQSALTDAYYVDIQIDTNEPIRFNVIKPLKATEYYQRIEWRNEYGGISFFDFTGARSESDSINIETYEKNIFDYHEANEFERKKIYKNDYKKSVSLTSHLMKEDGKWIFNSLMRSKKVWTTVNGKKYYIIPKSIEVNEDQTYNGIFTAKLTYEYSDI